MRKLLLTATALAMLLPSAAAAAACRQTDLTGTWEVYLLAGVSLAPQNQAVNGLMQGVTPDEDEIDKFRDETDFHDAVKIFGCRLRIDARGRIAAGRSGCWILDQGLGNQVDRRSPYDVEARTFGGSKNQITVNRACEVAAQMTFQYPSGAETIFFVDIPMARLVRSGEVTGAITLLPWTEEETLAPPVGGLFNAYRIAR